jgi:predicted membrane-bound spermidine synthase
VGLFTASGAAGLIYQVVWQSQLIVVFGDTTQAIGSIVSAFMAGLGLGGLVGGLIAPRLRHPLRFYGLVECSVGVLALFVPVGFSLIDGAYRSAYDTGSIGTLTLVRLGLSLVTVTPVTFLMGLTLPLLTRHLVTSMRDAGFQMGTLYSANTLGATVGALLSGFVLIELIGLAATACVAVALNLLAGAIALALSLRRRTALSVPEQPQVRERHAVDRGGGHRPLIYTATFVSGFVALSLEVLWTRLLSEGTGSTVYDFVVILAIFLYGIGVGSAIYRRLGSPVRDSLNALAVAFLGIAVVSVLTVPLASMWLPGNDMLRALGMLPATICMGYAFPLSARLLTREPAHGARSIGLLYLWNTVGSTLGSLAAAFLLAATLGTNASILVLAAVDAAVALALLAAGGVRGGLSVRWRLSVVAGAMAVVVPLALTVTGSPVLQTSTERQIEASGLPFVHAEDFESTVDAVGGPVGGRTLYTSGISMAAISVDTKLMAYIPKAIRPGARTFLDIAFGMGTTFRSAIILGMHTDAVDLSPTVPSMMPEFYSDAEQCLHSPLAQVITADGANYVRYTSRRYDIVAVDPPPPVDSAGAAVLYSQGFYQAARQILRPGGVMLQWLLFAGNGLEQFREELRTFSSVFAHVLVLISPLGGGAFVLGSDAPLDWSAASVASVLGSPGAAADISSAPNAGALPHESWVTLLDSLVWLRDGQVARFTGDVPLLTDDHPLTEYYFLDRLLAGAGDPDVTSGLLRRLTP